MSYSLAIDIGGTKFSVALFDGGSMTHRANPMSRIAREVQSGCWRKSRASSATGRNVDRCGIGFGGPVDFAHQRVALSTHVAGWRDFPLVERIAEMFRIPVVTCVTIDNDANAGALGEATFGAGRGHLPMFYMTLSTGIGGGIVLD